MNHAFKALPACLSQYQRDNLWAKVRKTQNHECWLWTAHVGESGYPAVWVNGIEYCATRIAYLDFYGVQPGELMVCHSCDTTLCMNPNHFFLGTHDDNMADRQRKGRQYKGRDHHLCKLTEEQVIQIFNARGTRTSVELAKDFGVSKSAIKLIWQGRNWSWLTGKVAVCK